MGRREVSTDDHPPPSSEDPPARRRGRGLDCEVVLQNPCQFREAGARRHRSWIEPLVAELAPRAESFVVRFVGDREMRRLNSHFRNLEKTTDVLSFPGSPESHVEHPPERRAGHLGDVVISVPEARRQAGDRGYEVERELRILALHGLLHCLGYDHETDDGAMERRETLLRNRWIGEPPPTREVGEHD